MNNAIGELVRKLRQDRGWTQEELATRAQLGAPPDKGWVSRIENGRVVPKIETLRYLADAFGVTVADLVSEIAPLD